MNIKNIKSEFPIFKQKINGKPLVYLDSAASAQKPKKVIEQIMEFQDTDYANVQRGIHFLSNASRIFKTNPFIKDFEYLNLFVYIYLNNVILKKSIRFKDLNIYSSKSMVRYSQFNQSI